MSTAFSPLGGPLCPHKILNIHWNIGYTFTDSLGTLARFNENMTFEWHLWHHMSDFSTFSLGDMSMESLTISLSFLSSLLPLNKFHAIFSIFNDNFFQVDVCWKENLNFVTRLPVDTQRHSNVDATSYRRWNDIVCLQGSILKGSDLYFRLYYLFFYYRMSHTRL